MIEVLFGLPAIALVALLLGGGWAALLHRVAPAGWIGFVFLSWSVTIVLTSAVWAWTYPMGYGVRLDLVVTLIVALAGYPLAWRRHSFSRLRSRGRTLTGLAAAFAVVLVALVPTYSSWTHLSMGDRIGPDGAGYAISARSLSDGTTRPALEKELLAQMGGGTIASAVSPQTRRVDTTPSISTQAAAEFLIGANRWGFPGTVGMVLYLVGPSQLWAILTLLAAFGLLTASVGVWSIVRETTRGTWPALLAVILMGLSPALLNAWHEGALAEMWILPACVLLARPLVSLGQEDRLAGTVSVALACALILVAFNDALPVYVIVFGLCMLYSLPLLRRRWWSSWWPLVAGAAAGGLLVTPSTAAFVTTLSQSLQERVGAGWPQPRWLDIAEAFGLHNAFGSAVPSLGIRSIGENITQAAEEGVVIAFLIAAVWRRLREPAVILLAAVITSLVGVYIQTRYVDHATNYQYFKTITFLVPPGALSIGVLIGLATARATPAPMRAPGRHSRRDEPSIAHRRMVLWLSGVAAAAVVVAAVSYVSTYRDQGTTVPTSLERLGTSAKATAVFDEFNVLAPVAAAPPRIAETRLLTFDLGAEVNLNWIGRNGGSPPTHLDGRVRNPVGVLIFEKDCPRFNCLAGVSHSDVPFRSDGVAVVELDRDTRSLAALPETQWPDWAAARFRVLGGGTLVSLVPQAIEPDTRLTPRPDILRNSPVRLPSRTKKSPAE